MFKDAVAEAVVAVGLGGGAVVDAGKSVGVIAVGVTQRGLPGQGFLAGLASAQAVIAVDALLSEGATYTMQQMR